MAPRNEHVMSDDYLESTPLEKEKIDWKPLQNIVWFNVGWFTLLHLAAFYGGYLAIFQAKWLTLIFSEYLSRKKTKSIVSIL